MYMHTMTETPLQAKNKVELPKTLTADAKAMIGQCVAGRARYLARSATQLLERELEGTGLTFPQFSLMGWIAAAKDDSIGALAHRTGLDQSTLSRNLRVLETQGLVEIASVADDQRKRLVWLTESGARKLEVAIPAWQRGQAALAEKIDPRALEQMIGDVWQLHKSRTAEVEAPGARRGI
jgi:DNA-binding MarR family transcriptional regulator